MNKTKYNLRHISCNMDDFFADRHRFRFEYDGTEYIASCYGKVSVIFDGESNGLPNHIKDDIITTIYHKIDKEENNWRYPDEAYAIADKEYEDNEEQEEIDNDEIDR